MQTLLRIVPKLLVVAAVVVVIVTLVGNHSDEYGTVSLPQGGVVHLPAGKTTVFVNEGNAATADDPAHLVSPLSFEVTAAAGGAPLSIHNATTEGDGTEIGDRSQAIGSQGAVASVEVPESGDYMVTGGFDEAVPGASIELGTTAFAALFHGWKLWVGLLAAAFLVSLLPSPRHHRRTESEIDAAPYQPPRVNPYSG